MKNVITAQDGELSQTKLEQQNNETENLNQTETQAQSVAAARNETSDPRKTKSKGSIAASTVAKCAIFAALAYLVSWFEFPVFPAVPFLKLDFSAVFVMLCAFALGPVPALSVILVKELLCFFTKSSTGGVGEIANVLLTSSYMLLPAVVYRFKKGIVPVLVSLAAAIVIFVGMGLIVNRYINFPLFMGASAEAAFQSVWYWIIAFNAVKGAAISVATLLLYKRLSGLLRKF